MRVLLIDDHTLFRSGLRELLERRGIEVCGSVGDGREGVEAVKSLEPDVVLLDMRMPDCLLYTSPSPRDQRGSRMPSSA